MIRRKNDPTDWMWAQACELMDQAERMHRQFFRVGASARTQAVWEPPADVFEDAREVVVVVALPGVAAEAVELSAEPGFVIVRAVRPLPPAAARHAMRQLEIPYGRFERRIPLPAGTLELVTHELDHGCLILRFEKVD